MSLQLVGLQGQRALSRKHQLPVYPAQHTELPSLHVQLRGRSQAQRGHTIAGELTVTRLQAQAFHTSGLAVERHFEFTLTEGNALQQVAHIYTLRKELSRELWSTKAAAQTCGGVECTRNAPAWRHPG